MRRFFLHTCAIAALLFATRYKSAGAEDRISGRGVYFREASTRIVEPMVQVSKTVPQGFDVDAYFLIDAVTSASVAAGANTDQIFTEWRKESGLGVGYTKQRTRVGGSFRYSTEPDYQSTTVGLNLTQGVWKNSGELRVNTAYADDTIPVASDGRMQTMFGGVMYSQALSPTWLMQAGYEAMFVKGFLQNPYIRVPNKGREKPPNKRLRHAWVLRVAKYFPSLSGGVQLHYRLYYEQSAYVDKPANAPAGNLWGIVAHTIEGRVFKTLSRHFELRLSYRYHKQGSANFWCNTNPAFGGRTDCYDPFDPYYSADIKWGALATHMPELKIIWDLRVFAHVRFWRIFSAGALDLSYGRLIQDTRYGNAHLLQAGFTFPL